MTRWDLMIKFIKENNYKTFAEIGVGDPRMPKPILEVCDLDCYIMVERKVPPLLYRYLEEEDVKDGFGITRRPIVFMRMQSNKAVKLITDKSLDLIFIDAEHDYKCVSEDIDIWLPKVKIGGILSGHDYNPNGGFPGPAKAVNERFKNFNLEPDDAGGLNNKCWWLKVY